MGYGPEKSGRPLQAFALETKLVFDLEILRFEIVNFLARHNAANFAFGQ